MTGHLTPATTSASANKQKKKGKHQPVKWKKSLPKTVLNGQTTLNNWIEPVTAQKRNNSNENKNKNSYKIKKSATQEGLSSAKQKSNQTSK